MALTRIKTDQIAAGAITGEAFHENIDLSGKVINNLASIGTLTVHGHSGGVGQVQLNCSENTHGQLIVSQPHSQAASNTLTLPGGTIIGNANAVLVSDTGIQTLTNKTISNGILTGTLNAGGATGANGQVLASTGSGIQWVTPGTSSGTVTSVSGTGTVSGLSLSGTVTSSGNLTLGGTLSLTSTNVTTALGFTPYNATNPNEFIAQAGARAAVSFIAGSGAYNSTTGLFTIPTNTNQLTNGDGFTTTTGTVTSVSLSGGTTGLTVSGGPITTSGTITLSGTLAVANGGTGVTTSTGTGSVVRSISPTFAGTSVFNNISVNGGSLTSTATTFNLVNTNTTTLNIGAAATALNLGSSAEGATATFAKNVTIVGNLTVQGTTTTEASASLSVSDSVVNLNEGATTNSRDIGLIGEYKPSTVTLYTGFVKDATDGVWKMFSDITNKPSVGTTVDFTGATFDPLRIGALTATNGTFTSALTYGGVTLSNAVTGTGNMVLSSSPTLVSPALGTPSSGSLVNCTFPTLNQNTTGNATTATRLQTARTIGGVSFNGTANINLPGVNTAGNQNTTGSAATLTTARTIGGVSFNGSANINLPGVNTAGNQNTTGNATTATRLQTARTIGGVSFNGSANINLPGVNVAGNQNTSGSAGSLSDTSNFLIGRGSYAAANIDTTTALGVWNQNNVGDSDTVLVFGQGGSTSTVQMRFKYTGTMEFRNRTDSVNWNAFKSVLTSANYTSFAPTLTGGGASGTWGINVTGNAASITNQANSATITASTGVNANHIVQRDGNGYIYANHINFNTGVENPTIANFITDNGDGWSRKSSLVHVKNQIRGVADGTWGINITGNAATATDATKLPLSGGTMTGLLATRANFAGFTGANDTTFSVRGNTSFGATMSFHRAGAYAVNFGLDTDNIMKIGGWSAGGIHHQWDMAGNALAFGSMRSPIFYDHNNTGYYADPNATSRLNTITVGTGDFTYIYCTDNNSQGGSKSIHANSNVIGFLGGGGSPWLLYLDGAGNGVMTGTLAQGSDDRLKRDWVEPPADFIERLATVKHGTYTRVDLGALQTGASANDMQHILPETVGENLEGMLTLAYGNAALVASIALSKRVVELERRLAEMEAKLNQRGN